MRYIGLLCVIIIATASSCNDQVRDVPPKGTPIKGPYKIINIPKTKAKANTKDKSKKEKVN